MFASAGSRIIHHRRLKKILRPDLGRALFADGRSMSGGPDGISFVIPQYQRVLALYHFAG